MPATRIAVRTRVEGVAGFEPLALYESIVQARGVDRVAILESPVGPLHAAQVSRILFDPVLAVSLVDSTVCLTGLDEVVESVVEHIAAAGVAVEGNCVHLSESTDLWGLLRCIRGAFRTQQVGPTRDFHFGFFGYLGYDVAWTIERLPRSIPRTNAVPSLMLSVYAGDVAVEMTTGRAELTLHSAPGYFEEPDARPVLDAIAQAGVSRVGEVPAPESVTSTVVHDDYLKKVETAQEHIAAGDIYQVQIGHEIRVTTEAEPIDVYKRLRQLNPSPYMFLATLQGTTILGASPEICVRVVGDDITVRPIAGTIGRGDTPEQDARLVQQLVSDEKEVAEHVMLVDLGRNDVGRVSRAKSLGVDELMVVEQYSHVSHLVSNIVGKLRDDCDNLDVIAATFPAGTVTGAPKVRAMEIIESLESTERGTYAGAVGLIDFDGYCITCLSLRSTSHRDGVYRLRASGGVVADSVPENEWRETLHKMAAPFLAVTGEEIFDARIGHRRL